MVKVRVRQPVEKFVFPLWECISVFYEKNLVNAMVKDLNKQHPGWIFRVKTNKSNSTTTYYIYVRKKVFEGRSISDYNEEYSSIQSFIGGYCYAYGRR
jgi:hypothetical protein